MFTREPSTAEPGYRDGLAIGVDVVGSKVAAGGVGWAFVRMVGKYCRPAATGYRGNRWRCGIHAEAFLRRHAGRSIALLREFSLQ